MRAGALDQIIIFQKKVEVRTSTGDISTTWVDHFKTFAEKKQQRAAEQNLQFSNSAGSPDFKTFQDNIVFIVRFDPVVNETFRIKYNNKYYSIVGLREVGRRLALEINCVAYDDRQSGI